MAHDATHALFVSRKPRLEPTNAYEPGADMMGVSIAGVGQRSSSPARGKPKAYQGYPQTPLDQKQHKTLSPSNVRAGTGQPPRNGPRAPLQVHDDHGVLAPVERANQPVRSVQSEAVLQHLGERKATPGTGDYTSPPRDPSGRRAGPGAGQTEPRVPTCIAPCRAALSWGDSHAMILLYNSSALSTAPRSSPVGLWRDATVLDVSAGPATLISGATVRRAAGTSFVNRERGVSVRLPGMRSGFARGGARGGILLACSLLREALEASREDRGNLRRGPGLKTAYPLGRRLHELRQLKDERNPVGIGEC